ncbi:Hypothetical predicted protein [Mytilus galloprovincialis]|uniref:Heme-binding protein 2 n=2 Tax=Mytilus galloprovincialis TaxID=29158 RepID=A0A8B6H6H0_MYTGA|nr:Hypothetical predicted protein [Mytilus galloprovincialis]
MNILNKSIKSSVLFKFETINHLQASEKYLEINNKMTSILKTVGSAVTGKFLEKPKYEKTSSSSSDDDVEERHYEAAKWVSTKTMGMNREEAVSAGFQRLFKYITGTNENNQKIDMTAPVSTKILPGAGPNCENTFTTSFYIPPEHQDNPPKPTNPDVFIEDRPAMDVYVKSFGGFAKEQDWLSEAQKMTEQIKDKTTINQDYWFTAGYNSPFQLFARTNEVWLIKNKDKE